MREPQKYRLNLDASGKELKQRGTPLFPCAAYCEDINCYVNGEVPTHWHPEIEMNYCPASSYSVLLQGQGLTIEPGDGIFINSNVLHESKATSSSYSPEVSFVFSPDLIAGADENIVTQRYVRPLIQASALPFLILRKSEPWMKQAADRIREAYTRYEEEAFGWELNVRNLLSEVWMQIVVHEQAVITASQKAVDEDSVRIKKMLDYIHGNYTAGITPQMIASSANISERECFRCFQKMIRITPVGYLLKYRISVAADRLSSTDEPVTSIALSCGFGSPSYFAKEFSKFIGCTPSAYRKANSG